MYIMPHLSIWMLGVRKSIIFTVLEHHKLRKSLEKYYLNSFNFFTIIPHPFNISLQKLFVYIFTNIIFSLFIFSGDFSANLITSQLNPHLLYLQWQVLQMLQSLRQPEQMGTVWLYYLPPIPGSRFTYLLGMYQNGMPVTIRVSFRLLNTQNRQRRAVPKRMSFLCYHIMSRRIGIKTFLPVSIYACLYVYYTFSNRIAYSDGHKDS